MGDAIFDNEEGEGTGVNLTSEQWETIKTDAETNSREREELTATVASLTTSLDDTKRMLSNNNQPPAPTPTDPSQLSKDDALTLLAKDPVDFAVKVADGRIAGAISQQLAPWLTPIIQTTHQNIVESKRMAHDTKFGVGNFDAVILPTLQENLDSLGPNSNALGDANTITALIERIEGTKRVELNDAEGALAKSRDDAEKAGLARIVSTLPASMRPKPEGGIKELSSEAKTMFDEIEHATGQRPKDDIFIATQNAKSDVSGFVTAMDELSKSSRSPA